MLNYYNVLEVEDFSSDDEIKQAYRQKCRQYHPDLVGRLGPKLVRVAKREMSLVNRAYEILGTPENRHKYDIWLNDTKRKNGLKLCGGCGIYFSVDETTSDETLCPECSSSAVEADTLRQRDSAASLQSFEIVKTCFVMMHHFTRTQPQGTPAPVIKLIIGGERMIISGPPGQLEITLFNKETYDLVEEDKLTTKTPWSFLNNTGRITVCRMHPAACARSFKSFCEQTLGEFELSFCRIVLQDGSKSYEHILNQSVIMFVKKVSPWTASKVFVGYDNNLVAACSAPESEPDENFFSLITEE